MPQARPKSQAQADVGAAVLRAKMKLESFNKSMRLVNHVRASHKQIAVDTAHHFASLEAGGGGGGGGSGDDVAFGIGSGGYNKIIIIIIIRLVVVLPMPTTMVMMWLAGNV